MFIWASLTLAACAAALVALPLTWITVAFGYNCGSLVMILMDRWKDMHTQRHILAQETYIRTLEGANDRLRDIIGEHHFPTLSFDPNSNSEPGQGLH